jgi:hypothetical protein
MYSYKKDNNNRNRNNNSNKYKGREFNPRLAAYVRAITIRYKY